MGEVQGEEGKIVDSSKERPASSDCAGHFVSGVGRRASGANRLCRLNKTHSNCNGRWLGRGRLHLGKSGQELLDLALLVWMMLEVRARHARYSCTVSNK
jgi:hypothetical protein